MTAPTPTKAPTALEQVPSPQAATGDARIDPLIAALEAKAAGTILVHPDGRVVFVGGAAGTLLGFDPTAAVQRGLFELLPSHAQGQAYASFQHALGGVCDPAFAFEAPTSDGPVDLSLQFSPIIEDNAVLAVMTTVTDVAVRHAVNFALRGDLNSSMQYGLRSATAMFLLDGRGQCTFFSPRWTSQTGQSAEQAQGTGWLLAMPEEARTHFRSSAGQAHQERRGWRLSLAINRRDGSVVDADVSGAPITDAQGKTVAYIGAIGFPDLPLAGLQTTEVNAPFVSPAAVASGPSAPAPKFAVKEAAPQGTTRALQEGYTDPSLLLAPTRPDDAPAPAEEVETAEVDKTTGLANRLLFAQHVQSTVHRMKADALTVAVSFIDLHGLDLQKQAVGIRVANDYLFLLAKRLESTIRSIEIAGRVDGNVLAVLSINWLFAEDLPIVARRLMNKLGEPLSSRDGTELRIAMNLGMAVAEPNEDVNKLFQRAWNALQTSKATGPEEFEVDFGPQG